MPVWWCICLVCSIIQRSFVSLTQRRLVGSPLLPKHFSNTGALVWAHGGGCINVLTLHIMDSNQCHVMYRLGLRSFQAPRNWPRPLRSNFRPRLLNRTQQRSMSSKITVSCYSIVYLPENERAYNIAHFLWRFPRRQDAVTMPMALWLSIFVGMKAYLSHVDAPHEVCRTIGTKLHPYSAHTNHATHSDPAYIPCICLVVR